MKLQFLLILAAALSISGCATHYTFEGKKYNTKEELLSASQSYADQLVASVQPLSSPLTKKALIFAMPSNRLAIQSSNNNFLRANSQEPNAIQKELLENITKSNMINVRVYGDAIRRKNIYPSVQFLELESFDASPAASPDSDVLYWNIPVPGGEQWYYVTQRAGKQVFAADRGVSGGQGKVNAFLDAVQAQALKE